MLKNTLNLIKNFSIYKEFVGQKVLRYFIFSIFVGLSLFFIETSFVFILQIFFHAIKITPKENLAIPPWLPTGLTPALTLLILFAIFRSLGYFFKVYLSAVVAQSFNRGQRDLMAKYSLSHANEVNSHEIIGIFSEKIHRVGNVFQFVATSLINFTCAFLFFLFGLKIAPIPMLIGMGTLIIFLLPLKLINNLSKNVGENLSKSWEQINKNLMEGMKNFFYLKIYGLVEEKIITVSHHIKQYENNYQKYYFSVGTKLSAPHLFGIITLSLITYISVEYLNISGSVLLSFIYIFVRLVQSVSEGLSSIEEFKLNLSSVKDIYQLNLKMKKRLQIKSQEQEEIDLNKKIEFSINKVSFGHQQDKLLFKDLNIKLKKGDFLLIQGKSGSGKSTLISLILGLYEPIKGEILINNRPVQKIMNSLYTKIGHISSDPYLIVGSLKENLLYGHPTPGQVTERELRHSLELAMANSYTNDLKMVLNEKVSLSTGQKQRLSFARAFLRRPKILIMDESTSNLDKETIADLNQSLHAIQNEMVTICVTHQGTFNNLATHHLDLNFLTGHHQNNKNLSDEHFSRVIRT